jgi:uncharacterized protein YkwD
MTGIDVSFPRTRAALALATVVIAAGSSVPALPVAAAHRARTDNAVTAMPSLEAQIIARINAARAQRGLGRLRLSLRLRSAADVHSGEMMRRGYFSHDSADGSSPWKRLARFYSPAGYRRWQVGEALLWYSPGVDAAAAVRDWLGSPEHRAILLAPSFDEIGVAALHAAAASGYFQGQEVTLITADFGMRAR